MMYFFSVVHLFSTAIRLLVSKWRQKKWCILLDRAFFFGVWWKCYIIVSVFNKYALKVFGTLKTMSSNINSQTSTWRKKEEPQFFVRILCLTKPINEGWRQKSQMINLRHFFYWRISSKILSTTFCYISCDIIYNGILLGFWWMSPMAM